MSLQLPRSRAALRRLPCNSIRSAAEERWKEDFQLRSGDMIVINNKRAAHRWPHYAKLRLVHGSRGKWLLWRHVAVQAQINGRSGSSSEAGAKLSSNGTRDLKSLLIPCPGQFLSTI